MNILKIRVQGQTAVWENPFEIVSGSQNYLYIKPSYGADWDGLDVKFLFRDRNGNEVWNSETNTNVTDGTDGLIRIPASIISDPFFVIGVLGYGADSKFVPTASLRVDVTDNGYDAFSKVSGVNTEEIERLAELVLSDFKAVMDSYAESMAGYGETMAQYSAKEENRLAQEGDRQFAETQRAQAEAVRQEKETERINAETERNEAEDMREGSEENRKIAETTRINNEDARVANENGRAQAENDRRNEEGKRANAESDRENNEDLRANAEVERLSSERERKTAETERKNAEEVRVSRDAVREKNEASRKLAEESREQAEKERADKWNNLNDAINAANEAKNEAENHKVGAEEAKNLAETAAIEAREASEKSKSAMLSKAETTDLKASTTENGGNTADTWELGAYTLDYGLPINSLVRIRTKDYILSSIKSITTDDKYVFELLAYDDTDAYVGTWNATEFSKTAAEKLTSLDFSLLSAYAYKYKLKFYRLNDATITPEEGYTHIHFHNEIFSKIGEVEKEQTALSEEVEGLKGGVESQQSEINKLNVDAESLKAKDVLIQSNITELITSTSEDGGNVSDIWEQGGISATTGNYKETKRIRTIGYLSKNVSRIYADEGYWFYVVFYDDENNYVAFWTKNGINTESDALAVSEFDLSAFSEYNIRLMLRKVDNTAVTVEEYTHIHFVNRIDRQIDDNEKVCKELDVRTSEDLNNESLWENGGVDSSNGSLTSSNYNLRTKEYVSDDVSLIYVEKGYYFRLLAYTKTGEWVGIWDGKEFSADPKHTKLFYANIDALKEYNVLILLRRYSSGTIDISEHPNIHFLNRQQAKVFYPTPTLTFIDDDGAKNALENWESICDEIGINITSCLVTGVMRDGENNPQKVSWDDVARLQNKGFEFVSHTHNHINLTERSEEVIHQQLSESVAALREHGCESRYLVYPYNDINEDLIPIVRQYFSAGVGYGTGSDNVLPIFTYHIRRHSINNPDVTVEKEYNGETVSVASFKSLDTLKGYIDTTLINGGWLIIMTHLRNDDKYYHDAESRQMIIDLCKYAIEKGMKIQKFGEAFERYKNIMETPHTTSVYGDSFYITDCNGVVHNKD